MVPDSDDNKKPLFDCGEPVKPGCYLTEGQENHFRATLEGRSICCRCVSWDQFDDPSWSGNCVAYGIAVVEWNGHCLHDPPSLPTAEMVNDGGDIYRGVWPWTEYDCWFGGHKEGQAS